MCVSQGGGTVVCRVLYLLCQTVEIIHPKNYFILFLSMYYMCPDYFFLFMVHMVMKNMEISGKWNVFQKDNKKANVHYSLFQVEDNHLVSEVILNKQILDLYLYSLPFIPSHLADNISIIIFNEFLHPCVFCVSHLFLTVSHLLTWKATRLHWVLFVFHFPSSFSLQVSWMHFLLKTFWALHQYKNTFLSKN